MRPLIYLSATLYISFSTARVCTHTTKQQFFCVLRSYLEAANCFFKQDKIESYTPCSFQFTPPFCCCAGEREEERGLRRGKVSAYPRARHFFSRESKRRRAKQNKG